MGALTVGLFGLAAAFAALAAASLPASSVDSAATARGQMLAKLGGCQDCHTSDDGAPFAGGRPIGTPFGAVYSANITPDPTTGIGRWTAADFRRAMRDGVAPGGRQLYPAFPYDHFTRLTDQDISDLHAFLDTRDAVRASPPANRIAFPFNFRPLIAIWKALYFRHGSVPVDPAQSADWNRGRYLVVALGHCGACHTPHNGLGAEHWDRPLAGGLAAGWYAPPMDRSSPAASRWTAAALETYLRTGLSAEHAAAAGPMGSVTRGFAGASPQDVHAMAVYIAAEIGGGDPAAADRASAADAQHGEGARLFAGACATCHEPGAPMMNEGRPDLALGTPLHESDPLDVVQIILHGVKPPVGRAGPTMPPFDSAFNDAQVAEIARYLRARYTANPPWPEDLTHVVVRARKAAHG